MNFVVVGGAHTEGGLSIDPALPVSDADLSVQSILLGYARSANFWGASGKIDIVAPYGKLTGSALYQGERVSRRANGFLDPALRLSVSLYGAPALGLEEFRRYRQDLLIGASVQVSIPVGQYDEKRVLNLGANRWSVKPEVGMSKVLGRWTLEASAAVTFFSINKRFFGDRRRTQNAIISGQANVIYNLPSGAWASVATTYFVGGTTSVDGLADRNLQKNWRLGLTAALPLSRAVSMKLNASKGVWARTGNNFDHVGLALQYRWGGGV